MNDISRIVTEDGKLVFLISTQLLTSMVLQYLQLQYDTPLRVEGMASYLSHKQEKSDSISEPATNEVDYALEVENKRYSPINEELVTDSASTIQRADAMPDEGQQEPAAPATEPSEVTTQGE